jgi:hypothetical protein
MNMSLLTPEQEEAMFQMFLESLARNKAMTNERRFEAGEFTVDLEKAPDEPGGGDATFQRDLSAFCAALRAEGIVYSQSSLALDAAGAHGFPLPEIVMAMKVLVPPIASAIAGYGAAWVQAKNGRKVRIRVGDVEVEGRTVAEVKEMLGQVASIRNQQEIGPAALRSDLPT